MECSPRGGQHGSSKALAKGVGIRTEIRHMKTDTHSRGLSGQVTALRALPLAEARPGSPCSRGVLSVLGEKRWMSERWLMKAGTFLRSPTCSGDRSKPQEQQADGWTSANGCVPRGDAGGAGGPEAGGSSPRVLPLGHPAHGRHLTFH